MLRLGERTGECLALCDKLLRIRLQSLLDAIVNVVFGLLPKFRALLLLLLPCLKLLKLPCVSLSALFSHPALVALVKHDADRHMPRVFRLLLSYGLSGGLFSNRLALGLRFWRGFGLRCFLRLFDRRFCRHLRRAHFERHEMFIRFTVKRRICAAILFRHHVSVLSL